MASATFTVVAFFATVVHTAFTVRASQPAAWRPRASVMERSPFRTKHSRSWRSRGAAKDTFGGTPRQQLSTESSNLRSSGTVTARFDQKQRHATPRTHAESPTVGAAAAHRTSRPAGRRGSTARSRRSVRGPGRRVVTTSSWSPRRSRVSRARHHAPAVADDQGHARPRPAAAARRRTRRAAATRPGSATCSRSASRSLQRRRLHLEVPRPRPARQPEPRASQRQRGALHQREDHHQHEDDVEAAASLRARRRVSGIVASTIGTAPRSPAQDRNACSRQRHPEPGRATTSTDSGRASSSSTAPTTSAGSSAAASRLGLSQQPEQHEQPDLGEPGQPLGEAQGGRAGAAAARCRAPARQTYDGEEAARRARPTPAP